jgi:hypothetical protein
MRRIVFGLALAALAGCGGGGPDMKPGEDCLSCHGARFAIAGTVFPSSGAGADQGLFGATIRITDANDQVVDVVSNNAGNFFLQQSLAMPLKQAMITNNGKQLVMATAPSSGACNSCHTLGGAAGGRLYAP